MYDNKYDYLQNIPRHFSTPVNEETNVARRMYEPLVQQISEFDAGLDDTQEVGLRLVSIGTTEPIYIEDIGFWGPDLIIFHGRNATDGAVQLLQHITQLSVLLTAVPRNDKGAPRIGIRLKNRSQDDAG